MAAPHAAWNTCGILNQTYCSCGVGLLCLARGARSLSGVEGSLSLPPLLIKPLPLRIRPGLEPAVYPEVLFGRFADGLFDYPVQQGGVGYGPITTKLQAMYFDQVKGRRKENSEWQTPVK